MQILVTGHKGYIGTSMVPILVKEGFDVTGLDSDLYRFCTFGEEPLEIPEIIKDIRDVEESDLRGFDAIIHLAALSNDPLGNINPDLTYEINYKASVRLAKLAKKAGVKRFLFSSSCSLYGSAGDQWMTEEASFNPVTPYGQSKVMTEQEVAPLADEKFSPVYLRNTTAYGVSPRLRFDVVLNNLVAWAHTTQQVYLKSDGTPWRPLVHIEDIAAAFIAVLRAPRELIHNQAFNVGINEENFQIRQLADMVKEVVPRCRIEYAEDAGPDKRSYRVDFSKIKKTLSDYLPRWTVRSGAEQLYNSYKKYSIILEDFEGPRYKRIDHIKKLINEGYLDRDLRWVKK